MGYQVVILVGGESTGTRFRPLSINSPKTLFPLAGKCLITHIIESLVNQLSDTIDAINLLGFMNDEDIFHKYSLEMKKRFKVPVKYYSEPQSRGTAGGLYYFRDQIFVPDSDGLIFIHGDIICDYPFRQIYDFHVSNDSDSTILGINPLLIANYFKKYLNVKADDTDDLNQNNILSNFGTILAKKNDPFVEHYVEKPSSEFSIQYGKEFDVLINGGIYFFKSTSIKRLLSMAKKSDSVTSKLDNISMELDILRNLPQLNLFKFLVFKSNEFWYHLKTPLSALLANSFFLGLLGKIVKSPKEFKDTHIGPNVTIGENVHIGKGVRIRNAIIGDNVVIGDNSFISNAIISNWVTIGDWCRVEGSITNSTICKDIIHTHSDGGIKYINNLVVLCERTNVMQEKFVFNSVVLPHKDLEFDTKYEIVM